MCVGSHLSSWNAAATEGCLEGKLNGLNELACYQVVLYMNCEIGMDHKSLTYL